MQTIEFQAMGCQMMVVVDSEDCPALQEVPTWFSAWELMFSRFKGESELSRLNASVGESFQVSNDFWEVLQLASRAEILTEGLVSPAVLPAMKAAGYDRSFECLLDSTVINEVDIQNFKQTNVCSPYAIDLSSECQIVNLKVGEQLDLGGFVKGWCADQVVKRLGQYAPVLMDAGGDMAMSRSAGDVEPWLIGIANPFSPDNDLCEIQVSEGGVATSGRDFRHWLKNGEKQHHIIDPRTSRPAVTDVMSATVIASSASEAEIAAKAIMILGVKGGLNWVHRQPQLSACLIDENQRVHMSQHFEAFIVR